MIEEKDLDNYCSLNQNYTQGCQWYLIEDDDRTTKDEKHWLRIVTNYQNECETLEREYKYIEPCSEIDEEDLDEVKEYISQLKFDIEDILEERITDLVNIYEMEADIQTQWLNDQGSCLDIDGQSYEYMYDELDDKDPRRETGMDWEGMSEAEQKQWEAKYDNIIEHYVENVQDEFSYLHKTVVEPRIMEQLVQPRRAILEKLSETYPEYTL